MPDVGIEIGAACMPSGHASNRATAPSLSAGTVVASIVDIKVLRYCNLLSMYVSAGLVVSGKIGVKILRYCNFNLLSVSLSAGPVVAGIVGIKMPRCCNLLWVYQYAGPVVADVAGDLVIQSTLQAGWNQQVCVSF